MRENSSFSSLSNTVINNGYCIGCGVCKAYSSSDYNIKMNSYGMYEAAYIGKTPNTDKADTVCPFADNGKNEDLIASKLYSGLSFNCKIGYYKELFIGYVSEADYRTIGSSGGIVTWLLVELLDKGFIDAVIQVKEKSKGNILFAYGISRSKADIRSSAKSKYYPMELSEALDYVESNDLRYAIVGVPCFLKAVRQLSEEKPVFRERIKYYIGIVCGHLKSTKYSEFLAMQNHIDREALITLDFRYKNENLSAGEYSCCFKLTSGSVVTKPTKKMFGTNWGYGFFKYKACDFCDDVFAETADFVSGDAWITPYIKDYMGTNIAIVRNLEISRLIGESITEKRLNFTLATERDMINSQLGGVRHKKDFIGYRVTREKSKARWTPVKRSEILFKMSVFDIMKQNIRIRMRDSSSKHFLLAERSNDYKGFVNKMRPCVIFYHFLIRDFGYFIPANLKITLKRIKKLFDK